MTRAVTASSPSSRAGERALPTESEVGRLLLAASERAPTGVRNRALIALLYCTGLRLEEALALAADGIDLERGTVAVRGRRARHAHLFAAAQPWIETWIAVREGLELRRSAPLLCTLRGEPLEPAYVRAMLGRLGKRAGLGKRIHAHGLRHAFTLRSALADVDREELCAQLGHRDARSLARVLREHGIGPARGTRGLAQVAWTLAPSPGAVRALVRLAPRERESASAAITAAGVLVRRWRPDEL